MSGKFRTIYAKEEKYIEYRRKFSKVYDEFKEFAEQESLEAGKVQKNSGKADSYARHLIRLIILYDEIFSKDPITKIDLDIMDKLYKVLEIDGFDEFNSRGKNFYSATFNCFERFIKFHNNSVVDLNTINDSKKVYEIDTHEIISGIYNYILAKGYVYSKKEIINFFLSLKSKPFIILSGISGTGKTKIAQLFAESIGATEENGQFELIPVRPDWNDGSDLLGYIDIKGEFQEGPLINIIKEASKIKNRDKPYIVLLDEMNLARVEHYFSDILSVMESKRWKNGEIVSSPLLLSNEILEENILLPNNLYIIGTVNMDETTYPFSKKVLDRANTIEFNHIDLSNLSFAKESNETYRVLHITNDKLTSEYLLLKDLYFGNETLVHEIIKDLEAINQILKSNHSQFGYRIRDEICFYLSYNEIYRLISYEEAFDNCIVQKILPRLSGSDSRIERVLIELFKLFSGETYEININLNEILIESKYPKSIEKIFYMIRRMEDGFTSFWIT